ncbi:hypothetical protein [Polaromonas sp.]|uniref:hypothetical protein n=1 Tax=Polaromonas sp. TaxID=1869339 RepID=UPI00342AAADB
MAPIVDGVDGVDDVGAYRTHIGSVHGRGIKPPQIVASEAKLRLAVHASHTVVIFVMERWLGVQPIDCSESLTIRSRIRNPQA